MAVCGLFSPRVAFNEKYALNKLLCFTTEPHPQLKPEEFSEEPAA